MSTSSTSRSTINRCSTSVESWSGRSSRTRPSRSSDCASSKELRCCTWWRRGIPSQFSTSPAGSSPHTQASGIELVGRRVPIAARSSPVIELNNDDLPDPVAPASATTVSSPDILKRCPARSTICVASVSTTGSSRPWPASAAASRASIFVRTSVEPLTRPLTVSTIPVTCSPPPRARPPSVA
jgi:hypothetical protein